MLFFSLLFCFFVMKILKSFQVVKCEFLLVSLWLYDSKLSIFVKWDLKLSPWASEGSEKKMMANFILAQR